MHYQPQPIDTTKIKLDGEVLQLTELLAENAHDIWAVQRLKEGWKYGRHRNDAAKEHPCLVAYEDLPETEKEYDRLAAMQTLKSIVALGYTICKERG
jgi:ryanodine receptor 2